MGKRTTVVRYARALIEVLAAEADLRRVEDDLKGLAALFAAEPELYPALCSPVAPARRRKELAERVLAAAGVHPVVRRLVALLAEAGQMAALDSIREEFERLCDQRRQTVPVEVITAVAMPPDATEGYRKSLERLTGRQVRLRASIDPAILGGVVTRVGSRVYDGSVRGQLQRLQQRLRGE